MIAMRGAGRMLLAAAGLLARVPHWLFLKPASVEARSLERQALARFAERCGILVDAPARPKASGTFYVSNHISWADIAVLGSLLDARFVARADLAGWPLAGWLARRHGTIFVERARPGDSRSQADAIATALASGHNVLLFAEGTTSDGSGVLPFRPALFAAAIAARRVQPVALAYRDACGSVLPQHRQRAIAWIGEDGLNHALAAFEIGRAHV